MHSIDQGGLPLINLSTISEKLIKKRKITSSLSRRENIRRNPFNRRNKRSTSLRFLYISRSYFPIPQCDFLSTVQRASCPDQIPAAAFRRLHRLYPWSHRHLEIACFQAFSATSDPSGASPACPGDSENATAVRASLATK